MKLYKVIFGNNKAVSAIETDLHHYENVEMENHDGKKTLKWLTVFADNQQESIDTANKLVSGYFAELLSH